MLLEADFFISKFLLPLQLEHYHENIIFILRPQTYLYEKISTRIFFFIQRAACQCR